MTRHSSPKRETPSAQEPETLLVDIAQAGEITGLGPWPIRGAIGRKELPAVRLTSSPSAKIWIRRSDLDAWIAGMVGRGSLGEEF